MLVHELLLSNGEGAEFVAQGVFILSHIDKETGQKALLNNLGAPSACKIDITVRH